MHGNRAPTTMTKCEHANHQVNCTIANVNNNTEEDTSNTTPQQPPTTINPTISMICQPSSAITTNANASTENSSARDKFLTPKTNRFRSSYSPSPSTPQDGRRRETPISPMTDLYMNWTRSLIRKRNNREDLIERYESSPLRSAPKTPGMHERTPVRGSTQLFSQTPSLSGKKSRDLNHFATDILDRMHLGINKPSSNDNIELEEFHLHNLNRIQNRSTAAALFYDLIRREKDNMNVGEQPPFHNMEEEPQLHSVKQSNFELEKQLSKLSMSLLQTEKELSICKEEFNIYRNEVALKKTVEHDQSVLKSHPSIVNEKEESFQLGDINESKKLNESSIVEGVPKLFEVLHLTQNMLGEIRELERKYQTLVPHTPSKVEGVDRKSVV